MRYSDELAKAYQDLRNTHAGWWDMKEQRDALRAENEQLKSVCKDYSRLRCELDRIKFRAYELGQIELHDMAWRALGDQE